MTQEVAGGGERRSSGSPAHTPGRPSERSVTPERVEGRPRWISLPRTVMALSYGDQWTNLLQPFWALALLGITGLRRSSIEPGGRRRGAPLMASRPV